MTVVKVEQQSVPHPLAHPLALMMADGGDKGAKGKWTIFEDFTLRLAVEEHGEAWCAVAEKVPGRTNKQCRDRWLVHTRSSNHTPLTLTEQIRLVDLHRSLGNQWKRIADNMEDRSEQHLKNLFNTRSKAAGPGRELLLHAYIHGHPVHTLAGLDGVLVYAVVTDTRDAQDRTMWSLDVQLWQAVTMQTGSAFSLQEVPLEHLARIESADADAARGMSAYETAVQTLGTRPSRLLLLTTGLVGLVGIAHPDQTVCASIGQLTAKLWRLDRRIGLNSPHRGELQHGRKRRRLTM